MGSSKRGRKIIVISGKQGSGKTSLARSLVSRLGGPERSAVSVKFADPIYRCHDAIYGVLETFGIRHSPGVKDGRLLQLLGTEWGRHTIGENVWVDACRYRVDEIHARFPETVVVIDDCRFENEFDAFPDALRIRLDCPVDVRKKRCEAWRDNDEHPSETGLDFYADMDKFDHRYNTMAIPLESLTNLVIYALHNPKSDTAR